MTTSLRYRAMITNTIYAKPTQLFGGDADELVKVLKPKLEQETKHSPNAELVVYRLEEVEVRRVRVVVGEDGEKRIEG